MEGNQTRIPYRSIVAYAIGGGWGKEEGDSYTVPVRVIRGTDFKNIEAGNMEAVPYRHETPRKVETRRLRSGDIVVEISGGSRTSNQSTGRSFLVTQNLLDQLGETTIPASFCKLVRIDQEVSHPQYVYYALQDMYFSGRAELYEQQSTGISNFQFEYFLDEETIFLPALSEQQAIAHVLGTLDDKIELNRRMNRTLEEMARAIFQDWFVDFGPTRAKMEGQEPYLPPELWGLFPDELVDSEMGEIPEGWNFRAFGDLLNDVIGGDWGKEFPSPPNTKSVSIIRGTDIPGLRAGGMGAVPTRFTSEKKAERRKLQAGDIILEVSGGSPTTPTGRSMIVTTDILERFTGTVVCASFCRRLRPRSWAEGLIASQHLDYLNSIGKMWEYQLQSTGLSNFQTKRFLEEEQFVWPDPNVNVAFAHAISPVLTAINGNENITLAKTRDALLPKLVSGEISVTES